MLNRPRYRPLPGRRTARRWLPLVAWLLLAPPAAAADPAESQPLAVVQRTEHPEGILEVEFENGLVLLVKENRAAPVVATRVFVRVGSIHEGDMLGSGVSHYFEHVISGGSTAIRTEAENRALLRRIGNVSNAYTSRNVTVYYITTEAQHFPTAADLLGDYMKNNVIRPEEFRRERGVIIQEIRKNRDNPRRQVHQLLNATMFPHHPVGQPVIGHLPLFRRVTREDVEAFYRRFYVANNTLVAVVGAVGPEAATATVARTFAGYERGNPNHPRMPEVPRQLAPRWAEKRSPKLSRTLLSLGHHTVDLDHPDLYALDVLADILGAGRTSRLYRALRETGLVHSVYAYSHTPTYNAGVFGIGAVFEDDKRAEVLSAILTEIERLRLEPPAPEELRRAIKHKVTGEIFRNETMEDQASDIGYNYLLTRDPNFTRKYIDGIRGVRAEEVRRVAETYLTAANRTVALLRPAAEEEEATGDAPATDAAPAAPTEPRLAPVERIQLTHEGEAAGMPRLLYQHDDSVGSVLVQLTFRGGVLSETAETAGVCRLMTTLLLQGTEERGRAELHEAVADMGARIWSDSGNNSWYVGLKLLPEDLEKGLKLLDEVIRRPAFAAEDFQRERGIQLQRLRALDDSWQAEADRFFRRAYFRGHPYARHPLGTAESLSELSLATVKQYHGHIIGAAGGEADRPVLAVFGNVSRERALQAARRVLRPYRVAADAAASLPRPEPPAAFEPPAPGLRRRANEKTQVVLTYGFPGAPFGAEELPALTVLDAVLSGYGYPAGRLHEALRGEADLVYLVHAWNWGGLDVGAFQILTQTSPENVPAVRERIVAALARLREEPVPAAELEAARESVVIADAIGQQTPRSRVLQTTYDELYLGDHEHHRGFAERIRAVTAEEVQAMARRVFTAPVLCATGPAAALEGLEPVAE